MKEFPTIAELWAEYRARIPSDALPSQIQMIKFVFYVGVGPALDYLDTTRSSRDRSLSNLLGSRRIFLPSSPDVRAACGWAGARVCERIRRREVLWNRSPRNQLPVGDTRRAERSRYIDTLHEEYVSFFRDPNNTSLILMPTPEQFSGHIDAVLTRGGCSLKRGEYRGTLMSCPSCAKLLSACYLEILADGTVMPQITCRDPFHPEGGGCDFRGFVRLEGWSDQSVPPPDLHSSECRRFDATVPDHTDLRRMSLTLRLIAGSVIRTIWRSVRGGI
jgi:hypothetical protein